MRSLALLILVLAMLLAGCRLGADPQEETDASRGEDGPGATADGQDPDAPAEDAEPEPVSPQVSEPTETTSVLPGDEPPDLAVATSRSLYENAPVVLLADGDDLAAQARAASVAVPLGAPMLLVSAPAEDGPPSGPVPEELDRLGATTVLTFGDGSTQWAEELGGDVAVATAPTDPDELAAITGTTPATPSPVAPDDLTAEVADLDREGTRVLELEEPADADPGDSEDTDEPAGSDEAEDTDEPADPDEAEDAEDAEEAADAEASGSPPEATAAGAAAAEDDLSRLEPAPPLDSLLVLGSPEEGGVAATATARAAGARVMVMEDPDPRADEETIAALADQPPETVLAFGEDFGEPDVLRRRLEVAATGVELPGGGQILFPDRRMVALYGHPDTPALGVLGEQPLEQAVERAEQVAADYEPLSDVPVVPTFEIIASIASASAGTDGNYSDVAPVELLRPWVDEAREAGFFVVLDLQPGRTDFLSQAQHYEELLTEPHVGLALDPEWRLEPDQVHLEQIGSVDAEEINEVVDWLADLTREHRLPQKLLLLHQFRHSMITNRDAVDTTRDELAVLIHADGHGTPDLKRETWDALTESPPPDVFWGWKNFYDQDNPTWSADEVLELEPDPLFISYQ